MRVLRRAWLAVRFSWPAAAWGFAGGLLLETLVPVSDRWLPAAASAAVAALALGCLAAGGLAEGRQGGANNPARPGRVALLERSNTWQQFGHAFATAAVALAALAAGLWTGHLTRL